jgi:hypothetical protein
MTLNIRLQQTESLTNLIYYYANDIVLGLNRLSINSSKLLNGRSLRQLVRIQMTTTPKPL